MPDADGLTSDEKSGEGEGDEMEEEEVVDPAHLHIFPIQTSSEEEWRTKRLGGGQIQMIQGGTGASKDAPY